MRPRPVGFWIACGTIGALACAAAAAPVTFSGTVGYTGAYTADTLYVAVLHIEDPGPPQLFGYLALPAPSVASGLPYAVDFDNATAPGPLFVAGLLDVDGSGFDPDSLEDALTEVDVLGWYDGHVNAVLVDPSSSRTDLDFALPRGEIRGEVVFAGGQTWAEVVPEPFPKGVVAKFATLNAAGPYAVVGLYAGDYIVYARGWGDICWGDWTCVSPTLLTLADGEVRNGIDLDFTLISVRPESWGRLKAGYR